MRKIFLLLVLLWCIVPACASQIPREITDAIPDSARPFLEDTDEADNFTSWNSGLSTLWTRTCKLLASTVQESLGGVILVMSAVLLCSVAEDCFHPWATVSFWTRFLWWELWSFFWPWAAT